VRERLARDGHAEVRRVREVERPLAAGKMHLLEHHITLRSVQSPPVTDSPLERAELLLPELPDVPPLELIEQRAGVEHALLVRLQ
jgi:hypothetical protein